MADDKTEGADVKKDEPEQPMEEETNRPVEKAPEPANEEKMDIDKEPESTDVDPLRLEENPVNSKPTPKIDDTTPQETDLTNTGIVNSSENKENSNVVQNRDKSIPENFAMMQDNKESKNINEVKKNEKENIPITNGNEESQYSMEEQTSDINNCYCCQDRNLNVVELQCANCNKWFHEQCISLPLGKNVPFMTYYTFFCKHCNPNGVETFSKKQPSFSQMCSTALANLMQQCANEGNPRTMFSKDKEVIPYIVQNWENLTTMNRRIKQTWHTTVYKSMVKDTEMFICDEKGYSSGSDSMFPMFGLVNQDLTKIKPCYETQGRGPQKFNLDSSSSQGGAAFTGSKGRSSKRKFFDSQMSGPGKKVKSDLVMPKLPPNGFPLEHPFNKDGYRYILAEPDPHAPFRREFDESQDWAGKPIPGWLYRKLTPSNVLIALHDRAPQLKVSEDRLSVTGEKGYCMARATHGVNRGTWYFECTIEDMPDGAATRLGWSQPLGNLQGPLGYDKFSYSWRSRKGTKFHESRGYHYVDKGYGQGDTLGFLIHLPELSESVPLPNIYKDKPLVKFKSYLYYEEKDEVQQELKNMKPLKESKLVFYKNGKCMGTAFENINAGTYYPAVSLYKSVTVALNFGPNFKYPPQEKCKPIYDLAHEATIEQAMTDLLYFTENKGKLRLDNL